MVVEMDKERLGAQKDVFAYRVTTATTKRDIDAPREYGAENWSLHRECLNLIHKLQMCNV